MGSHEHVHKVKALAAGVSRRTAATRLAAAVLGGGMALGNVGRASAQLRPLLPQLRPQGSPEPEPGPNRRPELAVERPWSNDEIAVGAAFDVSGNVVPAGTRTGPRQAPVVSVTVQVDRGPRVAVDLVAVGYGFTFSTTARLLSPGQHSVTVRAVQGASEVTETIPVATLGATTGGGNCSLNQTWVNYPNTLSIAPRALCRPDAVAGIRTIVRAAEAGGQHVHALGSGWSFSDCAITGDHLVATVQLGRELQTVQRALLHGQSRPTYHTEAGVTIDLLSRRLNRLGLALETAGGAAGQTLAGAISTGTHGGDKAMGSLADSVLALHLVGIGGEQYWIEPSRGITDPVRLKALVAPGIDPKNIVYDDALFEACLVSLGCMGVVYAVVLRVRPAYDLVETTREMTWQYVKANWSSLVNDTSSRFLQILIDPYTDEKGWNACLVTTRKEASPTTPTVRPVPDLTGVMVDAIAHTTLNPFILAGVIDIAAGLGTEREKFVKIINHLLLNGEIHAFARQYSKFLRALWPPGQVRGLSYSVMNTSYGRASPRSEPGYSIEMSFDANGQGGTAPVLSFVDDVIRVLNYRLDYSFLGGYVSVRVSGKTRAVLGMQQWDRTGAVEISAAQTVRGWPDILASLYLAGLRRRGLPHWGQQLDLGTEGHASMYPRYGGWRQMYARMSKNFAVRTFENSLSSRWNLTKASDAAFVSQSVPTGAVDAGQWLTATVTMRNTGLTTWTRAARFRLGFHKYRAEVTGDVPPGATATFALTVQPTVGAGGTFAFQGRMVQEGVEWFGATSPPVEIEVNEETLPRRRGITPPVGKLRPTGPSP